MGNSHGISIHRRRTYQNKLFLLGGTVQKLYFFQVAELRRDPPLPSSQLPDGVVAPVPPPASSSSTSSPAGLGISLEGTVDVERGREVRPHHYIRSILPGGPVDKEGSLCRGDELLQVRKNIRAQRITKRKHITDVNIFISLISKALSRRSSNKKIFFIYFRSMRNA